MGKKKWPLYFAGGLLFFAAAVLSLCFGAVGMTGEELLRAIRMGPRDTAGYIFWYVRLPRTAAALFAGAALSVSGCVLQRVLGNALASPGIVGVNAGAGLAVTVCCAAGLLSGWAVALSAFSGALAAAVLVMLLSRATGASRTTVILAGGEGRHLLPLCALFGAAFVALCDLAGRMLFAPYELPVGILLSVLGGPVFLMLLLKKRGGRSDA